MKVLPADGIGRGVDRKEVGDGRSETRQKRASRHLRPDCRESNCAQADAQKKIIDNE